MTREELLHRLHADLNVPLPLPGAGQTSLRHQRLLALGREDLSLARLAEAHWDAVAILAEAGRQPCAGSIYGVWASEISGSPFVSKALAAISRYPDQSSSAAGLQ